MKNFLIAAIIGLSTASGALAMTGKDFDTVSTSGRTLDSPSQLEGSYRNLVMRLAPDADLSNLTKRQVLELKSFLNDRENRNTGVNASSYIEKILES